MIYNHNSRTWQKLYKNNIGLLGIFVNKLLLEDNWIQKNIKSGYTIVLGFLFLWRNTMNVATQEKHLIEVIYLQFQHHGREHGDEQADMVLQKYLSILHFVGNRKLTETLKVHPHSDPFLQQCHTYFNKTTSPNSATPYMIFGVNYLWTTITMITGG